MSRPKFRGDFLKRVKINFKNHKNVCLKRNSFSFKENLKYYLDSLYNFLLSLFLIKNLIYVTQGWKIK